MAHFRPVFDDMGEKDKLTECGICLSDIDHPKALPCLHIFCCKCLKNVKHEPGLFKCPLCQEDFSLPPGGIYGFRNNFFIDQLKERQAILTISDVKKKCISCGAADRETAARCMDCNGFICQQCIDLHKKLSGLKVHTVFTIEELRSGKVDISKVMKEESCQEHKDQVLRWFCKTCVIPICRDCTVMEHSRPEHAYVTLASATEGQVTEITKLVATCKGISQKIDAAITQGEAVKKELKEAVDVVKKQPDDARKVFLIALEENHMSTTDKLNQTKAHRCDTIEKKKEILLNTQSKLKNAIEIANQVVKSGSMHDVASNYFTLTKTLTQLQDSKLCGISKNLSKVIFRPNQQSQEKGVDLGTLVLEASGIGHGKWMLETEIGKDGKGELVGGINVAIKPNRDILVADHSAKSIKVFDYNGQFKQTVHQDNCPLGVTVNSHGKYYVTDYTAYVKVYSPEGKYLIQFPVKSPNGTSSDTNGSRLRSLTIDNDGNLWVGSNKNYISKHKQDGTRITTIQVGICPCFIAVTSHGRVIVSPNSPNTGVQVLDNTGNLLHTINAPKDAKSWHPAGVCCSDDDVIYISSYDRGNQGGIYSFTVDGEYLECITTDVTCARGLTLTADDKLVVTQNGHPLKVFSFHI